MKNSIFSRLSNAWNVFTQKPNTTDSYYRYGGSFNNNPGKHYLARDTQSTIVASLYNRIALDVSTTPFKHAEIDSNGRYLKTVSSELNTRLSLSANIDQIGRALIQDLVLTMFDKGVVAVVIVDSKDTVNIMDTAANDILSLRVGTIVDWFPKHVRVNLFNEERGEYEDVIVSKYNTAIIENPLYQVMNEPNSNLQRLIRKLALLDIHDKENSYGKLDIIMQLPYVLRNEKQKMKAEERRQEVEKQLSGAQYGIAYTDGTEKITQLNRPAENNLLAQIQYYTTTLYSQLGITEEVFNGTANEEVMLNYHNATVEPILTAISTEFTRKFLSIRGRASNQAVIWLRDPFKLVTLEQVADIADKFTRNEIATANEIRPLLGFAPSDDPHADELRNKNLNPIEEPILEEPVIEQPIEGSVNA